MSTELESPSSIKITWLIGVVAAFSIFAVIAWYSGHMTRAYPGYEQQRAAERYATLQKLQADENKALNPVDDKGNPTAEWIDQSKGTVHIPIDEAMVKEVETLKAQTPQMGAALPVITPAPAPAAPAASTNAAPAKPAPPNK
jgi:hypothetical protein